MPEEIKPASEARGPEKDAEKDAQKSRDEVALELMKFIAVTTGYGKGSSAAAGFQGKPSKSSDEYTDALLHLFERCRSVVAKPVQPAK